MNTLHDLRTLITSLQENKVDYILIGGQSLALHGFPRATEDVDLVVPYGEENGRRMMQALSFLKSAQDLEAGWFTAAANADEIQGTSINSLSNLDFIYDDQIFSITPNLRCGRHDILLFFGYFSNFRPLRAHLSCRCVSDNWTPASRRT